MIATNGVFDRHASPLAEGYRKVVRRSSNSTKAGTTYRAHRRLVQANPEDSVRSDATGIVTIPPRMADPVLWDGINDAYQALVEKGFLVGLTEEERATKEGLARALERLIEPYDLARLDLIEARRRGG